MAKAGTIGKFDKVVFFCLVDDNGEMKIPVAYSKGLDALALLSAHRYAPDRSHLSQDFVNFADHAEIGEHEIEQKYLTRHVQRKHKLKETRVKAYHEQHGEVAGITQDLHYRYYEVEEKLQKGDFKHGVEFIPYSEVRKQMDKESDWNKINVKVGTKTYRVDMGVAYAIQQFEKERAKKSTPSSRHMMFIFL